MALDEPLSKLACTGPREGGPRDVAIGPVCWIKVSGSPQNLARSFCYGSFCEDSR